MTVLSESMVIGTVTDYGDQALLLQFDSTAEVLAWSDVLRGADLPGVVDIVPASKTVLIKLHRPRYQGAARQAVSKLRLAPEALAEATAPPGVQADVVIDVVYDGADLEEVGKLTGLSHERSRRRAYTNSVAGRILRLRTGFRLPGRRRRTAQRAPAIGTTNQGARRLGRAGGRVQRRVPARVARRLAADRPDGRGAVGCGPR